MTATIQQAVFENNEGARLVRQCQFDAAVKSFTSVLKIMKPLAAILEDNDRFEDDNDIDTPTTTPSNSSSSTAVPFKISFTKMDDTTEEEEDSSNDTTTDTTMTRTKETMNDLSSSSSPPVSPSCTHRSIASKHNCNNNKENVASSSSFARKPKYFVFRDPVVIPPESLPSTTGMITDDDDIDDNDELSLYSSEFFSKFLMIVMYNLALTLHLHAISLSSSLSSSSTSSSGNNRTYSIKHIKKLFLRSRKLYELAFEMHLDADVDLLFTLALINNLGLIYYTVNERDRSRTCFKNMFSTMMYLMDSNESQSIKEWDGLLSNAMDILKIGNEVAAPAA